MKYFPREKISSTRSSFIQGYSQRMRLQRRLYGIYTVSFIHNFITGFALCQTFNNASKNMTITRLIYVFCLRYSNLMAYLIIWQLNKQVYSCRESWIIETERINSLESYPRSHSLWVTLFFESFRLYLQSHPLWVTLGHLGRFAPILYFNCEHFLCVYIVEQKQKSLRIL